MWNKLFFLYGFIVLLLSGLASAKLSQIFSKKIKYLNEIVLTMSASLSALCVGLLMGGGSEKYNSVAAVSLIVFSLVIESLLIAIVSSSEFKALDGQVQLPSSCQNDLLKAAADVLNGKTKQIDLANFGSPECKVDYAEVEKDVADNKPGNPGGDAKTIIIIMLVLNSVGIVGGIGFQFLKNKDYFGY